MLRRVIVTIAVCLFAIAATAANFSSKPGGVTNNDDSCDIAVTPAATLLLPYFEIDFNAPSSTARTTLFTVMNVSRQAQLARITLWTDWAFPAYSFDVFLTGYGVVSINVRDLFVSGRLPSTPTNVIPGPRSDSNFTNPNHLPEMVGECALRPDAIPPGSLTDLRSIFTIGKPVGVTSGCNSSAKLGGTHANAIGYATIDVVATCSTLTPNDPAYYATELLFDNVLTGDYEYVSPDSNSGNYASGNPLVHIRAIPEGGPVGSIVETNLPYTFYDRFTTIGPAYPRTMDRRQPLPSTFAARWIQGGAAGFNTSYEIWREGYTGAGAACARYADNSSKQGVDVVRFDEHENSFALGTGIVICTPPPLSILSLPATASVPSSSSVFPQNQEADVAGWMYINVSNGGSPAYSALPGRDMKTGSSTVTTCARQSQSWIVATMSAEGRYSATWDATPLGNGCSISPKRDSQIGPAAGSTP
ncbi:MAG: hypothetical protein QOI24_3028 [Acidobacteriota bacterium]|jgi:hypothetical protein|nr:hypothetical protein [Acidobacteriota bacterium]